MTDTLQAGGARPAEEHSAEEARAVEARAEEARTGVAGVGLCCLAVQLLVTDHYLRIGWTIEPPVPVAWWALAVVAALFGPPLILVGLGGRARRLIALPWGRLLTSWVLPGLVAHLLYVTACFVLLHRAGGEFAGIAARDVAGLPAVLAAPPPELGLLYALALFPVLAKLSRRVPAALLVAVLCAATLWVHTASLLVFLTVGARLSGAVASAAAPTSRMGLLRRASVALAGSAVLGVDRVPDHLAAVLAGLAALPFGLAAAGYAGGHLPEPVGRAAAPGYLLLAPAVVLANAELLARLSALSPAAQLAAAVAEPLALALGLVAATPVLVEVGRRLAGVVLGRMAR